MYGISKNKPKIDIFNVTFKSGSKALKALRLEILTHKSIPKGLSFGNGNFVLNGIRIITIVNGKEKTIKKQEINEKKTMKKLEKEDTKK